MATKTLAAGTYTTVSIGANAVVDVNATAIAELIRDTIGTALTAGTGVTVTVNDAGDTITVAVDTTTEAERIRDVIGAALVAGTNMTVTVSDAGDTITLDAAGGGGGGYTQGQIEEFARDALGTALTAGSGITITPNDGSDTITVASSITQYTDEMARDAIGTALTAGTGIGVSVNDGADTITVSVAPQGINAQTGTTYTPVLSDDTKLVTLDNASAITFTWPQDSDVAIPIGSFIAVLQLGAGQITHQAGTGATVNATPGLKHRGQYSMVVGQKRAANTWVLVGDLTDGYGQDETIIFDVSGDTTTTLTTGTNVCGGFRLPFAFYVTGVGAFLDTASSSGTPTFDINDGGTSILSTKITIDANEKTSTTAATAAVISDANIALDAEITIDVDTAGTGAKGARVWMTGRRA